MSSVTVITGIIIILCVLVCYAFVFQTIQNKRQKRARLLSALQARARTFKYMLSGFPANFLSKDLTLLVYRSLIEVCEQLVRLDPNEASYAQDLQSYSNQMLEVQKQTRPSATPRIDSPQQIKEIKMCLEELHKFLYQLEAKNVLPKKQADSFRNQIKFLVLQVTVDNYTINGRKAMHADKKPLSLHYFNLALNLIVREGKTFQFQEKAEELKAIIAELEKEVTNERVQVPISDQEQAEQAEVEEEWDKFSDQEDNWKKKNVYD